MIQSLIDKQDSFEIIRDEIAAILVTEVASQKALATGEGKDPTLWDLKVYTERSNPWENYLNSPESDTLIPTVNIWYDNSSFDPKASNIMERQKTVAIFNIDCYGAAVSSSNTSGGHNPGDKEASLEVQRALRLVRNILMAAEYTYLGLRGLVWGRWPQSVNTFQPQLGSNSVQQVVGARIAFKVTFNEFSPQYVGDVLELVAVDIIRAEDGQILLEADYDYTI